MKCPRGIVEEKRVGKRKVEMFFHKIKRYEFNAPAGCVIEPCPGLEDNQIVLGMVQTKLAHLRTMPVYEMAAHDSYVMYFLHI
jgi:hypothetical protein